MDFHFWHSFAHLFRAHRAVYNCVAVVVSETRVGTGRSYWETFSEIAESFFKSTEAGLEEPYRQGSNGINPGPTSRKCESGKLNVEIGPLRARWNSFCFFLVFSISV